MNKLRSIVNKHATVIVAVVFIITFLIRLHELHVFRDFNSDKARQLHASYSYIHGKGMAWESYNLNTFLPMLLPNIEWPPMYAYMVVAISKVSGQDLYNASVTLDYLNLFALWLGLLWLFRLIGCDALQQIILLCFLSFSKPPLLGIWSSDMIGLTLFILSAALSVQHVQRIDANKKQRLSFYVFQLAIMTAMMLLKYSLIPALFSVAGAVLTYYYSNKNKAFLKSGVLLGVLAVVAIGILIAYNQSISGNSSPAASRHAANDAAIHFANLYYFYPFISGSLFYLDILSSRFNPHWVNNGAVLVTFLLLAIVLVNTVKKILAKKADYFEYLTFVTSIVVTGFFILLSLKYKKDQQGIYFWTYVKEYRYFAPAIFIILIYLFREYIPTITRPQIRLMSYVLMGCLLIAIGLKGYYIYVGNKAASFDNMYGKVFKVAEDAKQVAGSDAYFMSYTKDAVFDTQLTSLVAINGTKVAMSYYGYFADSTFKTPFTAKQIPARKKIVVYLDKNIQMLDTVNSINKHRIETTADGEQFLVLEN